ncbi:hypothetical protein RJ639_021381 [Escallonia herrerae]|uniref:Retrotransposon gag domain-containing protein n=1 Tax=Escallonia herrerae TaxID=1293975 RepID=A0AA88V357_9ASTE|nr:hypothetical protein RJ639_021381 [Escallonia herrerae]
MPPYESYAGSEDTMEHLAHFTSCMNLYLIPDQITCPAYLVTLKGAAHVWFQHLAPHSISCWAQLAESFGGNFLTNRMQRKNSLALLCIVQGPKESLKSYYAHFNAEKLLIDHLGLRVTFAAMARGVRLGIPLRFSLNKHPPGGHDKPPGQSREVPLSKRRLHATSRRDTYRSEEMRPPRCYFPNRPTIARNKMPNEDPSNEEWMPEHEDFFHHSSIVSHKFPNSCNLFPSASTGIDICKHDIKRWAEEKDNVMGVGMCMKGGAKGKVEKFVRDGVYIMEECSDGILFGQNLLGRLHSAIAECSDGILFRQNVLGRHHSVREECSDGIPFEQNLLDRLHSAMAKCSDGILFGQNLLGRLHSAMAECSDGILFEQNVLGRRHSVQEECSDGILFGLNLLGRLHSAMDECSDGILFG